MTRWIAIAPVLLGASPALAATFPADGSYIPLHCNHLVMFDLVGDAPPNIGDRDIIGEANAPAGLRDGDDQNLYLRLRVDQDPAPGAVVRPFAWGMELDLDGDRTTYELLITVDGIAGSTGTVSVFTNHTTTLPNDPADPADLPAAFTATFAAQARTIGAGTTTSANPDFFVDIAIPWTVLEPLGLGRDTKTYVWAGSSTVANALDGDIACHDGTGGGKARLDGTASDETTGDPTHDPNGGGSGSNGNLRLEGGGGCQAGGGGAGFGALLVGLFAALRRRRSTSAM